MKAKALWGLASIPGLIGQWLDHMNGGRDPEPGEPGGQSWGEMYTLRVWGRVVHSDGNGHGTFWWEAEGSYWGRCSWGLVPMVCSGPPCLGPDPGQQTHRDPRFQQLLLNSRSVNNKSPLICDLIRQEQGDLDYQDMTGLKGLVQKTWLGQKVWAKRCLAGFQVWHKPRFQGRGR